jgi:hypothetical protein
MGHFPGELYQIDAETLRGLNRLAVRLSEGPAMTPDERSSLGLRIKGLLRQAKQLEASR